jgi:hypothetical protein
VHLSSTAGADVTAPRVKDGQPKQLAADTLLQQFTMRHSIRSRSMGLLNVKTFKAILFYLQLDGNQTIIVTHEADVLLARLAAEPKLAQETRCWPSNREEIYKAQEKFVTKRMRFI